MEADAVPALRRIAGLQARRYTTYPNSFNFQLEPRMARA